MTKKKSKGEKEEKPKYEVYVVDGDEFNIDPDNLNRHKPRGRQMAKLSMMRRGYGRPAFAAGDGTLLGGNMSTGELAKEIGLGDGKVIVVETDGDIPIIHKRRDVKAGTEEAQLLALEDNRSAEASLLIDSEKLAGAIDSGLPVDHLYTNHELDFLLKEVDIWGDTDETEWERDSVDEYRDTIEGVKKLADDIALTNPDNLYGIPDLREDRLAPMPEKIKVWAGPDASDKEWVGEWLYNYGTDSIRGLDLKRTTLAFYTDDKRWAHFWTDKAKYVAKILNSGIRTVVGMNFSMELHKATAEHIYNFYRARYMGRYMQEAGLLVIPDIIHGRDETLTLFTEGIPKYAPCLAMEAQTWGNIHFQSFWEDSELAVRVALDELAPDGMIVYGGSKDFREFLAGLFPNDLRVLWLANRASVRDRRVMSNSASVGGAVR